LSSFARFSTSSSKARVSSWIFGVAGDLLAAVKAFGRRAQVGKAQTNHESEMALFTEPTL